MCRKKAFTLIEVGVVLAIVGLLACILLPVLGQAKFAIKRTSCLNNLHQLGLATLQYAQDNDERLPGQATFIGTLRNQHWQDLVYKYTNNEQVFTCPADYDKTLVRYHYVEDRRFQGGAGDMACNGYGLFPVCADMTRTSGRHLNEIADPSRTVWVTDSYPSRPVITNVALTPTRSPLDGNPWYLRGSGTSSGTVERHNGAVVVFCDGHVKLMRLAQLAERHNGQPYLWTKEDD